MLKTCTRLLAGLMMITGGATPLFAADIAHRDLLGFSPDGQFFAFEQYAVQDGSGFAQSEIFVLDLDQDAWVDGAPFAYRSNDETESILSARQQAHSLAQSSLDNREIVWPAFTLASNPMGSFGQNPYQLDFGVPIHTDAPNAPGIRQQLTLHLLAVPTGADCSYIDGTAKGYALIWTDDNGVSRDLHRDTQVPTSRGCPTDYRISEVVQPFDDFDPSHAVALISTFSLGFEGYDRRFIAVPLR